ncbi:hypothetical protein C8J57DRAFT_1295485 [Mycena rebaudengoi]|nr:hypothetical protein C8J57DRAFT_1295485 [Mycena rebaudengoi]
MAATPVLTLPFEITAKIFLNCLPDHRRIRPSTKTAPLLPAQICQQWRSVALSTPELWSSVAFEYSDRDPRTGIKWGILEDSVPVERHESEQWANRSYLTFRCSGRTTYIPEAGMRGLAAYASRCGRIELEITMDDFMKVQEVQGPFPLLHSLSIAITDSKYSGPLTAFHPAPNLRELRLLQHVIPSASSEIGSPHLTHLEMRSFISITGFTEIAQRFPLLRHLSLPYMDERKDDTTLIRYLRAENRIDKILKPLQAALLSNLQCLVIRVSTNTDARILRTLFAESPFQLSELAARTIATLRLRFHRNDRCRFTHYPIPSLPSLRTLGISEMGGGEYNYAPFEEIVMKNKYARAELLLRSTTPPPKPEICASLAACAEEGCVISITTHYRGRLYKGQFLRWPEGKVDDPTTGEFPHQDASSHYFPLH